MATFTTHVLVGEDGSVHVNGLPLQSGQEVQVVIKTLARQPDLNDPYPLRQKAAGGHYYYIDPFEPIDSDEWESRR